MDIRKMAAVVPAAFSIVPTERISLRLAFTAPETSFYPSKWKESVKVRESIFSKTVDSSIFSL